MRRSVKKLTAEARENAKIAEEGICDLCIIEAWESA
jgi:hypothetical protein